MRMAINFMTAPALRGALPRRGILVVQLSFPSLEGCCPQAAGWLFCVTRERLTCGRLLALFAWRYRCTAVLALPLYHGVACRSCRDGQLLLEEQK